MLDTNADVNILVKDRVPANADTAAVFMAEGSEGLIGVADLPEELARAAGRVAASGAANGKVRQVAFDLVERPGGGFRRVYVAGLGPAAKVSPESVRQAAGALFRALRKHEINRVTIVPPAGPIDAPAAAEAVATGLSLAAFEFNEYKGTASRKRNDKPKPPLEATIVPPADFDDAKGFRAAVERGRVLAEAQNFARTVASRPGNALNPPALAKVAQDMARQVGLTCRVLDEKQMAKLGMGGILAVGGGSPHTPPRMIVLEHRPRPAAGKKSRGADAAPLLLVGKSITFDTGGVSIKPAEKMGRMIYDKCGGMAVLGAMAAIARLKLDMPVVGILSSAENHLSDLAYRPGDILRMYNGVTVEVTNTDAEGRLVLGDALAWGIETYKPRAVVDLATLTGGVVVALGKTMAGVMSDSDTLVDELTVAAALAGEKLWRLPLGDEQRDQIKSDHADIVNSAGREGHPLQGGAFLSHFVPGDGTAPWAHLDIAGVADTEKELPYYAKGATGWGVRTLVEWIASKREAALKHATPRAAGG